MAAQVPLIRPLPLIDLVISLSNEPLGRRQIGVPARIDILPRFPLCKRRTANNNQGTKDSNIQPVFSHGSDCTVARTPRSAADVHVGPCCKLFQDRRQSTDSCSSKQIIPLVRWIPLLKPPSKDRIGITPRSRLSQRALIVDPRIKNCLVCITETKEQPEPPEKFRAPPMSIRGSKCVAKLILSCIRIAWHVH